MDDVWRMNNSLFIITCLSITQSKNVHEKGFVVRKEKKYKMVPLIAFTAMRAMS
jgi:hypothetical protein